MKIQELFAKPVDRPIEGVIKADDDRHLLTEVDEYVLTDEVCKGLDLLVERYLNETNANGAWISGFFGSGKSHLLKILSMVLENRELPDGQRTADLFLPKFHDEILKGEMGRAIAIPSRSILFNIDQKADNIGGNDASPILEVFVKVFNEMQGFYAKQGHIADFERDLDRRGELDAFKATYAKVSGRSWAEDLPVVEFLENETFAKAYAQHSGNAYEEALKLLDRKRESYRVSIESFAQNVREYIDKMGDDFRLNFFVDEVGQFIGQNTKLMLNLQTVAETLATVCDGRSWVFVTSQGDLKKILGDLRGSNAQDFTRIEARFKTRLTLTSADVREVIQKRLLAKTESEPEVLTEVYDKERENLQTLYRFGDKSITFKTWRGSDEFCAFYPFPLYQFDLFQRAIERLSEHDAFTGKQTAIGERSMLAVFQEVAKEIRQLEVGGLATFDLMYEGIASSIRGDLQTSIRQAALQYDDQMVIKVLKCLFLLKWVRGFKATARNVAILLIDQPQIAIAQHQQAVAKALSFLEGQSLVQRNDVEYEYLTDTEKDIEVEIRNTEVDESQLSRLLTEVLYQDVLRDVKVRLIEHGKSYTLAQRLDDQLVGRDQEISINIITPEHKSHGEVATLAAQNTGKPELLVILPADQRLTAEARRYLKTEKYVSQTINAGVDQTRNAILTARREQNGKRRQDLTESCRELMSKAPVFLNGSKLDRIGEGEARNRFAKAGQELVQFAYPSLRMLKGTYSEEGLSKVLLEEISDLFAGTEIALSESEDEVMTYVMRNQKDGERMTVQALVDYFERRPYGWPYLATLTFLGRLFRAGKVELRITELLSSSSALAALKNTRQHATIRIRLQEQFTPQQIQAVKQFHHDFLDRANPGTDARSVADATLSALRDEAVVLRQVRSAPYGFLAQLDPVITQLEKVAGRDYTWILRDLHGVADELLTQKEDLLDPVKAFINGQQRQVYDEVLTFLREQEANFSGLPGDELALLGELEQSQAPFRGNLIARCKAAVAQLTEQVEERLAAARKEAQAALDMQEARLKETGDYQRLDDGQREAVLCESRRVYGEIGQDRFISTIRQRVHDYKQVTYPQQLKKVTHLARATEGTGGGDAVPEPDYVRLSGLTIDCQLSFVQSEDDLEQYLDALRAAALAALRDGNRIIL